MNHPENNMMQEEEKRIREKYGALLDLPEENSNDKIREQLASKAYKDYKFDCFEIVTHGFLLYALCLWFYFDSYYHICRVPFYGMLFAVPLYFVRWRGYSFAEKRIVTAVAIMLFIYAWFCLNSFYNRGSYADYRILDVLDRLFYAGIPALVCGVWLIAHDDRVVLLFYLGGINFLFLVFLAPGSMRLLVFVFVFIARKMMSGLQRSVCSGTYTKSYLTMSLNGYILQLLILLPSFIFIVSQDNEEFLLVQIPGILALYIMNSFLVAMEYVFYGREKCDICSAFLHELTSEKQ